MFKKNLWIVALVAVLAVVFVGCGESGGGGGGDLVETVVFDLATDEIIQALALGPLAHSASADVFGSAMILEAGGADAITYEAVAGPGSQDVSIKFTTIASWGPGIDMPQSAFHFRVGDVVTITGNLITMGTGGGSDGPRLQLNRNIGGEYSVGNKVTTEGPFTITYTIVQGDMSHITTGAQTGMRLEGRTVGMVAQIDNIRVVGMRSASGVDPEVTHYDFNIKPQLAGEVEAVAITAKAGFSEGAITVYYTGIEGTTYSKNTAVPQAVGKYRVTFDVAAATGYKAATGLIAGVLEVVAELEEGFPNFSDATKWDIGQVQGSNGYQWAFSGDNFATFKAAKYVVIATIDGGANADGFGGMQFGVQGNGENNWTTAPLMNSGDWTTFSHNDEEIVYLVIDLAFTNHTQIAADATATQAQFVVNWGLDQLGEQHQLYITSKAITRPASDTSDLKSGETVFGYITRTVDLTPAN